VVERVDSLVMLGTVRLGPQLEGMGPEGRGEAASATVTALLRAT